MGGLGAFAVPAWCTYVPVGVQQEACRGSSAQGCKCSDFCKDQPANTQGWNPECCGCKGASAEAGNAATSLVASAAPAEGLGAFRHPAGGMPWQQRAGLQVLGLLQGPAGEHPGLESGVLWLQRCFFGRCVEVNFVCSYLRVQMPQHTFCQMSRHTF